MALRSSYTSTLRHALSGSIAKSTEHAPFRLYSLSIFLGLPGFLT